MEDKSKLRILKMQRTKMLNKAVKTVNEFTELQEKLNRIELEIKEIESEVD